MSTHKRYQQISAAVAHGRDHQREPWGRHTAALHAPGLFPRMVSRGTNSENITLRHGHAVKAPFTQSGNTFTQMGKQSNRKVAARSKSTRTVIIGWQHRNSGRGRKECSM